MRPIPANLWRVHWFNDASRTRRASRALRIWCCPTELTGVDAPIVVLIGRRFPMIGAHKVLAAYACLVPRLVTGRFDPARDRAVWPSTGNYCRGGVAISRILGCRGVAVLPAGMSRERFDWLRDVGERSGRHRPHARHREQRQGNLRRVRGAGARSGQRHPQPVLRVRQLPHSLQLHGPRVRSRLLARESDALANSSARSVRLGDRLGRNDRGRRLSEERCTARAPSPSKRSSARRCCATATASTTSRASATSTSRSFTT